MLRFRLCAALFVTALLVMSAVAWAHFGVITHRTISLPGRPKTIPWSVHPSMEMQYMEMASQRFGVMYKGRPKTCWAPCRACRERADQDRTFTFWKADFTIKPGDYTFFMEPTPTETPRTSSSFTTPGGVDAREGGSWDKPVGESKEIVPSPAPMAFGRNLSPARCS
jgi:hypothetical protein